MSKGRPRNIEIDKAVLDTTADILDSHGYKGVIFEEIARRTGVSKSALYRRWPDRRHLVLAVLRQRLGHIVAPQSGCTHCDLHESLVLTTEAFCRLGAGTLAQIIAENDEDPDFHNEILTTAFEPTERAIRATILTGQDRGDINKTADVQLLVDALTSLVFYRLLLGQDPMSSEQMEETVDALIKGVGGNPESLAKSAAAHEQH